MQYWGYGPSGDTGQIKSNPLEETSGSVRPSLKTRANYTYLIKE